MPANNSATGGTFPIRVGTSGWSYDDWVGPFYPDKTPKAAYLEHYAARFDCVEVDSTYYAIPRRSMVEGWASRTSEDFRFALKAPSVITHEKVLRDCDEDAEAFFSAIEPLKSRTLCVLLQFGYFNRGAFASAGPFFERLTAFLAKYGTRVQFAVEIRNKNWLTRDYFDLLRSHNAVCTLVEHAWLPPLDQLIQKHDVVTGPFSYLRLIGDRDAIEKITKTWERVVIERDADLERVAASIRQLATRTEVVTFINNHYAGHGPEICRRLLRLMGDRLGK